MIKVSRIGCQLALAGDLLPSKIWNCMEIFGQSGADRQYDGNSPQWWHAFHDKSLASPWVVGES